MKKLNNFQIKYKNVIVIIYIWKNFSAAFAHNWHLILKSAKTARLQYVVRIVMYNGKLKIIK